MTDADGAVAGCVAGCRGSRTRNFNASSAAVRAPPTRTTTTIVPEEILRRWLMQLESYAATQKKKKGRTAEGMPCSLAEEETRTIPAILAK